MILRSIHTQKESSVSHDPSISKRVLLGNGEIPHLTQFATSRIPPGEATSPHSHADMIEVFLVQRGSAEVTVDGTTHRIEEGGYIAIQPGEVHILKNSSATDDLELLYFGIAE